ncbi:Oligopeptide ABC transporter ATP-binding protein OppF [Candidatus Hepatincolaceae symbiont of Richtersius coronifer]
MNTPLLSVKDLSVIYKISMKKKGHIFKSAVPLYALNNINFDIDEGEILGIVGESGCGKSTLGKSILRLLESGHTTGSIFYKGQDLNLLNEAQLKVFRKDIQIIFQDPLASLNPKMLIKDIIAEPLKVFYPNLTKAEVSQEVYAIMDKVGLARSSAFRYPHEFSGGQCQRIGIARAMILKPKLLICDEAVSALDVSIKAQIINLLQDLKNEFKMSIIFISHDLSVVKYISDNIIVLYLGFLVEKGKSEDLYLNPAHPYTEALISSIPFFDAKDSIKRIVLKGDIPSPLDIQVGCPFYGRCLYGQPGVCNVKRPELIPRTATNREVACFFPLDKPLMQRNE